MVLFPVLFINLIVFLPDFLIYFLVLLQVTSRSVNFAKISHDNNLLVSVYIGWGDLSVVQMHVSEISCIFFRILRLETDQIGCIIVSFEENRGIVVEVKVKKRNIFCVAEVLKSRKRLISELKHQEPVELE